MDDRTLVLVASGDEGTRAQVRLTLGEDRFELVEAENTDEAIRAIAAARPALLVLDLALPGTGALALARSARAQPETADAATLVLLQRGDEVPDSTGVDATLAMPATSFALLRKVDDLLGDS